MWFTSTGIFFFGIAAAFSSDYYSFMIARFLLAMVSRVCGLKKKPSLILLQYFRMETNCLRLGHLECGEREKGLIFVLPLRGLSVE